MTEMVGCQGWTMGSSVWEKAFGFVAACSFGFLQREDLFGFSWWWGMCRKVADDSHGFLDDMDRRGQIRNEHPTCQARGERPSGALIRVPGWYPDPATSFLCGPKRTWSSFTGEGKVGDGGRVGFDHHAKAPDGGSPPKCSE